MTRSSATLTPRPRSLRSEVATGVSQVRAAVSRRSAVGVGRSSLATALNVAAVVGDGAGVAKVRCPACGWSGARFRAKAASHRVNPQSECPGCGAAARHRALALTLPTLEAPTRVCHFAPEPVVSRQLAEAFPEAEVETTDLFRTDVDHPGEDIQALGLPDGAYDLVICNHVLEHVPDDAAAIAELARITRPGGRAVITVPGEWTAAATDRFPAPDLNGHHRHYGLDVLDALRASFGRVDTVWADEIEHPEGELSPKLRHEPIFVCAR